jgi:hypothetical protein
VWTLRSARIRGAGRQRREPPGLDVEDLAQGVLALTDRGGFLARQEPAAAGVIGVARREGDRQAAG